jgi:hypothetical protein
MSVFDLLQQFARSLTQNFASLTPAQPEDQLKPVVAVLLEGVGQGINLNVLLRAEAQLAEIGGRPDFGVDVNGLLCGYIELKAPGVGARPRSFRATEHNGKQWKKFKSLPNLIYTDGNEWSLFRTGEQIGVTLHLQGDVTIDGAHAVSPENATALERLFHDFLQWKPIVPARPRELARLLAPLCRFIRSDVEAAISDETSGLSQLAQEWRAVLFPEADDAKFADAYAQTLTYGLLLARVEGQSNLNLDNAANALDGNHGLLAAALRALGHPNARREIGAGIDTLLRVLNALDPDVWREQGQMGGNDPWLYFYEDFLAEYDKKLRDDAGVYYTPVPVIKAQVRLIDEILRTRFGKPRGFNAPDVTVLDPAAGTGAYPLAVLEKVMETARQRSGPGAVAGAATDFGSRLYAFEFLVGPYAVAHLRMTQAIQAAGGHLPPEGASVYLCDTLESPFEAVNRSFFMQRLAIEHERARLVKRDTPILVCLGNPPYDRQQRQNQGETLRGGWIRWGDGETGRPLNAPLESFLVPARAVGNSRFLANLYNDYVYFWRWALWKTFENSEGQNGIVCFITASSYLRGPGFVGMRRVMRETFDEMWIIDLEGDNRGARPTENVFNIQTGVAIALGIRIGAGDSQTPAKVKYSKITGTRSQKLAALDTIRSFNDVQWRECPSDWLAPFLPVSDAAYYGWPELMNLFPWQYPGVKCHRTWPIGETEELLRNRWRTLMSAPTAQRGALFHDTTSRHVGVSYRDERAGIRLPSLVSLPSDAPPPPIRRYGFRSFDRQWIIDDIRLSDRFRFPLWQCYGPRQVYLTSLLTEILGNGPAAVVTAHVPDLHHFSGRGGKDVVPLWRDSAATEPNITVGLLSCLGGIYGKTPRPEDLFAYCYALLSPRAYVQTFADELLLPSPRIPLTRFPELFSRVAMLGQQLIRCHTFGERNLEGDVAGQVESGKAQCIQAISPNPDAYPEGYLYDAENETLHVGDGAFAPVSPEVWNYSVSGLFVVRSWLDYRKRMSNGRRSSALDNIRPERWTATMTDELLEVLWTLEKTIELEPQATALLEEVLAGNLINAAELPAPTPAERAAPDGEDEAEQVRMEI